MCAHALVSGYREYMHTRVRVCMQAHGRGTHRRATHLLPGIQSGALLGLSPARLVPILCIFARSEERGSTLERGAHSHERKRRGKKERGVERTRGETEGWAQISEGGRG